MKEINNRIKGTLSQNVPKPSRIQFFTSILLFWANFAYYFCCANVY